jgi:sugar/nucleoside kinase (ribokinase family)
MHAPTFLNHPFFSVEQIQKNIDCVCIENALVDFLVQTDAAQVEKLGMIKGIMQLVEKDTQNFALNALAQQNISPEMELGGSASNVARGLAFLGARAVYSSKIGEDELGHIFSTKLDVWGIRNRLAFSTTGAQTGTSFVVVTPDGDRTLNTHLGACREYTAHDVPLDDIAQSKIFYSTGYILDTQNQINAFHIALEHALLHNTKVAFDIADPFVVVRHGVKTIMDLLEKAHLVFGNADEVKMLIGQTGEQAARTLSRYVSLAVVKDGANGAFIAHNENVTHIPAKKIKVTDTTGAGDMFAAGFIYGLCRGYTLADCGHTANLMAADTISQLGAKLSPQVKTDVEDFLREKERYFHT